MRVVAIAPVQVSFHFVPNLVREADSRLSPPLPTALSISRFLSDAQPQLQNARVRVSYGPHAIVTCTADRAIFRPNDPLQTGASMKKVIELALAEDVRHRKEMDRYNGKTRRAILVEYQETSTSRTQLLVYESEFHARMRSNRLTRDPAGALKTGAPNTSTMTFLNSSWDPTETHSRECHRSFPIECYRIADHKRFPNGPCDRLTWDFVSKLKPGDEFGTPLPDDRPLALGFDKQLADIGFNANSAGHNCVTDFGIRYSLPLRCPTPQEWSGSPLPIPLDLIHAMRDTPAHSWLDEVMSFVGQRVLGIELGAPRGSGEPAEPTAVLKHRKTKRSLDHEEPCYNGPRKAMKRLGRYLIFVIERPTGLVYLVDSKWRDKEVAMHLFATLEAAEDYCNGKRNVLRLGRKTHDPARLNTPAWDAPGVVEGWIDRCVQRAAAPEAVVPCDLDEDQRPNQDAELETVGV